KSPIYCVAAVFQKLGILHVLVPEEPMRLFIPLIFSGGIWNFLLSHPTLIQRIFTRASILDK
ncbi:MAG: hypothetical protein QNK40_14900, partial [Desulfobacterales bacterium]|nr:hypothetical protein [Desulfobacterales bacterium]